MWLKDLETGAARQLTHSGGDWMARVAPDGRTVAVQRKGERHIDLFDVSDGRGVALCDDCRLNGYWSSDGSRLLVGRSHGELGASVILDVKTRREAEIANHPAGASWRLISRPTTGGWRSTRRMRRTFVRCMWCPRLRDADPVRRLGAGGPDFGIFPNWSSDGTGIYHFSLRDGYMCAWLQAVDPR